MNLKMTPNTVSNYLFAQLRRTVVGEGSMLIHKFREVLNYLKMSGAHFNGAPENVILYQRTLS